MKLDLARTAGILAVTGLLAAAAPAAAGTGVTHLVFEKSAKMKKIAATLYLPFAAGEERTLRCGVVARGKNGALPVAGALGLRLIGEAAGGSAVWASDAVSAAVDENGDAWFAPEEVATLAASAPGDAAIRLVEVRFKGGRGGRAIELTVDCLPEEAR